MTLAIFWRSVRVVLGGAALLIAAHAGAGQLALTLDAQECAAILGGGPALGNSATQPISRPAVRPGLEGSGDFGAYVRDAQSASGPVVGIVFDRNKGNYALHSKDGTFNFGSHDIDKLADKLMEQTQKGETFYWIPDGFENQEKTAAFETSLRLLIEKTDPQRHMRNIATIPEKSGDSGQLMYASGFDLPRSFFAKGSEIKDVKQGAITDGPYQGWWRVIVRFAVRVKDEVQIFTIAILVKTEQMAREVLSSMNAARTNPRAAVSAATIVAGIEQELRRAHPELKNDEIGIVLQEEFAKNYLVDRVDRRLFSAESA